MIAGSGSNTTNCTANLVDQNNPMNPQTRRERVEPLASASALRIVITPNPMITSTMNAPCTQTSCRVSALSRANSFRQSSTPGTIAEAMRTAKCSQPAMNNDMCNENTIEITSGQPAPITCRNGAMTFRTNGG